MYNAVNFEQYIIINTILLVTCEKARPVNTGSHNLHIIIRLDYQFLSKTRVHRRLGLQNVLPIQYIHTHTYRHKTYNYKKTKTTYKTKHNKVYRKNHT